MNKNTIAIRLLAGLLFSGSLYVSAQQNQANASERLSGRTQQQSNLNAEIDRQTGDKVLALAATALSGGKIPYMGGGTQTSSKIDLGNQPGIGPISTYGQNNVPTGFEGRPNPANQYPFPQQQQTSQVQQILQSLGRSGNAYATGGRDSTSVNLSTDERERLRQLLGGS